MATVVRLFGADIRFDIDAYKWRPVTRGFAFLASLFNSLLDSRGGASTPTCERHPPRDPNASRYEMMTTR